ncbi:MAG: InlB B-repeat-containing protein, partial [Clostridia bacterium]|nr:InlB B-repeat-containing protein [Clostridia bacterium]
INKARVTVTAYGAFATTFTGTKEYVTKVYDGNTNVLTTLTKDTHFTVSSTGKVPNVTYTASYASATAGTREITATFTLENTTNYEFTSGGNTCKINGKINKKSATLTLGKTTMTIIYGLTDSTTYTYEGDGTVSVSTLDSTIATASINTSSKTIVVTSKKVGDTKIKVVASAGTNYASIEKEITVTVVQAEVTVSAKGNYAPGASTKEYVQKSYDGTTIATITKDVHYLVSSTGAIPAVNASANYSSSAVGIREITANFTLVDTHNFKFVSGGNTCKINGKINAIELKVTADNKTMTYGDSAPKFTVTVTGFVNGETVASLGGTLVFTIKNSGGTAISVGKTTAPGTYTITPSGYTSSNYTITYIDGTLTVNKKALIVTADNKSMSYGGVVPTFTVSITGFVNDDSLNSLTGTLVYTVKDSLGNTITASSSTPVGTYTITPSGLSSANYDITFNNGTLTVHASALTPPTELKWSETYRGTATWNASPAVQGITITYEIVLYQGGTAKETKTTTSLSYNFVSSIRSYGAGVYTFKVRALSSSPTNCAHSVQSSASDNLYAVSVAISLSSGITSAKINNASSYVMINGETGIAVTSTIKTGYTFTKWTSSSTNISFASMTSQNTTTTLAGSTNTTTGITLTPTATPNTYNLIVNPNGGVYDGSSSIKTYSVPYETPAILAANPTREGYTFTGYTQTNTESGNVITSGYFNYGHGASDYSSYVMSTASSYVPNGLGSSASSGLGATSGPYCANKGSTMSKAEVTTETNPVLGNVGTIQRVTTTNAVLSGSYYYAGMSFTAISMMEGHTYYYVIVAKIPSGWTLNVTGDSNTFTSSGWLTETVGTGNWATYIYKAVKSSTGYKMGYGHLYLTSRNAPSGNVVADIAMAKWYDYSLSRSEVSGLMVNNFYTGTENTTLTATWKANTNTVTTSTVSADGSYTISSDNLFNSTSSDVMKGGELYTFNTNPGNWAGSVSTKASANKFTSGYIRLIPGATYKITGSSSGGNIGWTSDGASDQSLGSQLTTYTNNTTFTAPTSYTDTSTSATTAITYTYMRFDSALSDLSSIKLVLVSTPVYTGASTAYVSSSNSLTFNLTPNTGYKAYVTKTSGAGTLTNTTLSGITGSAELLISWTANVYKVTLNNQNATTAGTEVIWYKYNTVVNGVAYYTDETCTTALVNNTIALPSKTGFTLDGFYTKTNGQGDKYINNVGLVINDLYRKFAQDVTLYAMWVANTYTVTFDANSGTVSPTSKTVTYGNEYGELPTPERTGYTFVGWFTDRTNGEEVLATTIVTTADNHTIYAHWNINSYTLTVNYYSSLASTPTTLSVAQGGSTVTGSPVAAPVSNKTQYSSAKVTHTYSTAPLDVTLAATTVSGKLYFISVGSECTPSSKQNTTTHQWTPSQNSSINVYIAECYTITYKDNHKVSGNLPSTDYKVHNTAYTVADNTCTRTGYTANGWNTTTTISVTPDYANGASYAGNSNLTLYLNWIANAYTITLNQNGATTNGTTSVTAKYEETTSFEITNPEKIGYTFKGFYSAQTDGEKVINTDGTLALNISGFTNSLGQWAKAADATLYAQWQVNSYVVTADAGVGAIPETTGWTVIDNGHKATATVTFDSPYGTLPTPRRTGYIFDGWYFEDTYKNTLTSTTVVKTADNHTIYAKWTPDPNTNFTVYHYVMDTQGAYPNLATQTENLTGTTDSAITLASLKQTSLEVAGGIVYKEGKVGDNVVTTTTLLADGSLVIKLYYQRLQHEATIDANNGYRVSDSATDPVTKTYYYGQTIEIPEYRRDGYTLTNYTLKVTEGEGEATGAFTFNSAQKTGTWTIGTQDETLSMVWTVNQYTLTADANGGVISGPEDWTIAGGGQTATKPVTFDAKYGILPEVSRVGYTFDGWFMETKFENEVTEDTIVKTASNHSIYAKWTANTYAITLNQNGADIEGTLSVEAVYEVTTSFEIVNPQKVGYSLEGFYSAPAEGVKVIDVNGRLMTNVTGYTNQDGKWARAENTTLYAVWKENTYTLTLDALKGTLPATAGWTIIDDGHKATKQVQFNSPYGILIEPVLNGYRFDGWYKELSCQNLVTAETLVETPDHHTLYPKWTAVGFEIFMDNTLSTTPGDVTPSVYTTSLTDDTYIIITLPLRTGYTLTGFTISGDDGMSSVSEDLLTLTIPPNTYGNITLTPVWTANKYNIVFNGNGSTSGSMTTIANVEYDSTKQLPKNDFVKEYNVLFDYSYEVSNTSLTAIFTFNGWNADKFGGFFGSSLDTTSVVENAETLIGDMNFVKNLTSKNENVTLYATWTTASITLPSPQRTGYTFSGWYKENTFETLVGLANAVYTPTESLTLYAKWTANVYKVTLDAPTASATGTTAVWYKFNTITNGNIYYLDETCETALTDSKIVNPSKLGYIFNGYFTQ